MMDKTQNTINDTMKLVDQLTDKMDELIKGVNVGINQLPNDQRGEIVKHQAYLNKIMKTVKQGDLQKIQTIIDKHADSTTK